MHISWRILAILTALSGCTSFDPVDQRVPTFNKSAADYANDATLLNVIRASKYEPLTFMTITGVSGTQSVSGGLGLPGITFGPHPGAPRTYTFGPNSISRNNQNTFNVSVVDDPTSFSALLTPINPAMIAFLIRQGYPRELLFFLFTDELRQVKLDPKTKHVTQVVADYRNNPDDQTAYPLFIGTMATLLRQGLSAQIDVLATPTGKSLPASKLCIDRSAPPPNFVEAAQNPLGDPGPCENAEWIEGKTAGAEGGGSSALNAMVPASDGSLWVALGSQNKILHVAADGRELAKVDVTPPAGSPKVRQTAYFFSDDQNNIYQLFPRSTYGVYDYVGAVLRNPRLDLLRPDASGSKAIVNIVENTAGDCFASASYRGADYCVPENATHTKRLFTLLHELVQLNTAPSNTPTTLNVTGLP